MSEKDVWVEKRGGEDVFAEEEERRSYLGCSSAWLLPCLHDYKRYPTRKVSHWLKRQAKLRYATNNCRIPRRTHC